MITATTLLLALLPLSVHACGPTDTSVYHTEWLTTSQDHLCLPMTGHVASATSSVRYGQGNEPFSVLYVCGMLCLQSAGLCRAYAGTASYDSVGYSYGLECFLYTSTVPERTACTTGPERYLYGYRDDTNSCFSKSMTDAVRYCSYLLGRDDPVTSTTITGTLTPTEISTVKTTLTKTVCKLGASRRAAAPMESLQVEPTEAPAALFNAASMPRPTARAALAQPLADTSPQDVLDSKDKLARLAPLAIRANSAPMPQCIDTVNFPIWETSSACQCLTDFPGFSETGISTAPTVTTSVTSSVTVRVLKSAVSTFGALAKMPGGDKAGYNLISRMIKDSQGASKRVMLYSKPQPTGSVDIAKLNIGPYGLLSAVTTAKNNLQLYGLTSVATSSGVLNVLGGLPEEPPASAMLADCVMAQKAPYALSCKIANQEGPAAVFSEILVPGEKNKYMLAVGSTAVKGAKVVTLYGKNFGTVIVGCGGST